MSSDPTPPPPPLGGEGKSLRTVCEKRGRGGPHRRSRADELALTHAVAEKLGRDTAASTLRELWLEGGFSPADRRSLGNDLAGVFALEEALAGQRDVKLRALGASRPDARRRAAEWWLKTASAPSSRRTEALLCAPIVADRLADALGKERLAQVREALTGALAVVVAEHFPDSTHLPVMRSLANDRHSGVRFFAVRGLAGYLGRGAGDRDVQAIGDRLRDGARGVREAAAIALERAVTEGRLERARAEDLGLGGSGGSG